jgi:hypothetical protein
MRRHSAHVDANVLAELDAGLIAGRRATRIHAHLAGCERCTRVSADLTAVSVLLAAAPPPAMPDAVTRRLSATIAMEAAARTDADRSGAAVPGAELAGRATISSSERARRDTPRPARRVRRGLPALTGLRGPASARAFAAAAAACVLAAGGYAVAQLTSHGPISPAASGGNGRKAVPGPLNSPKSGLNRPGIMSPGGPGLEQFSIVKSGTDYQPANLAAQIEHQLLRMGSARTYAPTSGEDACVLGVTGGNRPTMVDVADYKGHPATVIAMAAEGTHFPQAWIVGPACSATNQDILARVVLARSAG